MDSSPSMTRQHRQGKSMQEIANNMLPGLAKETVSSRMKKKKPIYKYREQRHLQWSMLVGSCWFSAMLRHSLKLWQWDFRTGIRLLFSSRGTLGYFNNEKNTDMSLNLLWFFKGEGWVKRAVIERGGEKNSHLSPSPCCFSLSSFLIQPLFPPLSSSLTPCLFPLDENPR